MGEKKYSYSMGELLYSLYRASSEGRFTKKLIICILESYTIMLTRIYRNYVEAPKSSENRNRIIEIMGASVSSSWSNLIMPKYLRGQNSWKGLDSEEEESQIVEFAAVKFTSVEKDWAFEIIGDMEWPIEIIGDNALTLPEEEERQRKKREKEQLQMMEILCMFFTNVSNKNARHKTAGFTVEYLGDKEKENNVRIDVGIDVGNKIKKGADFTFRYTDGCFNVMNFVNNLFLGEEYFEKLHESMEEAWIGYFEKAGHRFNEETSSGEKSAFVKKFLRENSLYADEKSWWEESKGLALPIYSFDMMYNLFKRCYLNQEVLGVIKNPEDFLPSILKLLESRIGTLLEKEEKYYYQTKREKQFYDHYKGNPFLKYIERVNADERLNPIFGSRFHNIVQVIAHMV